MFFKYQAFIVFLVCSPSVGSIYNSILSTSFIYKRHQSLKVLSFVFGSDCALEILNKSLVTVSELL